MILLKEVTYRIKNKVLVNRVSTQFEEGEITMILGPNGAGKSSLLNVLSGVKTMSHGKVLINGKSIQELSSCDLSLVRSVLLQHNHTTAPFKVEEVVMMGRYPHFKGSPTNQDVKTVSDAMQIAGVDTLGQRLIHTLSGGEQQRVHFARVLAQLGTRDLKGKYLLLDEPVSALDVQYQHEMLQIVSSLSAQGLGAIVVIHDLNLALQYADKVMLLYQGKLHKQGKPMDVIQPQILEDIYKIPFASFEKDGQQFVVPSHNTEQIHLNQTNKHYEEA